MEHTLCPEDYENDQEEYLDMCIAETQVETVSSVMEVETKITENINPKDESDELSENDHRSQKDDENDQDEYLDMCIVETQADAVSSAVIHDIEADQQIIQQPTMEEEDKSSDETPQISDNDKPSKENEDYKQETNQHKYSSPHSEDSVSPSANKIRKSQNASPENEEVCEGEDGDEDEATMEELDMHVSQTQYNIHDAPIGKPVDPLVDHEDVPPTTDNNNSSRDEVIAEISGANEDGHMEVDASNPPEEVRLLTKEEVAAGEEKVNDEDEDDTGDDDIDLHVSQTQLNLPAEQLMSKLLHDITNSNALATAESENNLPEKTEEAIKMVIEEENNRQTNEAIEGDENSDEDDNEDDGEFINLCVTQSDGLRNLPHSPDNSNSNSCPPSEEKSRQPTLSSLQYSASIQPHSFPPLPSPIVSYASKVISTDEVQTANAKKDNHAVGNPNSRGNPLAEHDSPTQLDTYLDSYSSIPHAVGTRLEDLTEESGSDDQLSVQEKQNSTELNVRKLSEESTASNNGNAVEDDGKIISLVDDSIPSSKHPEDIQNHHDEPTDIPNVATDCVVNSVNLMEIYEEEYSWIDTRATNSSSTATKNVTSSMKKPFQVPVSNSPTRDYMVGIISSPTRDDVSELKKDIASPEKTANIPDIWKLLNNLNSMKTSLTNNTIKELKQTLLSKLQELSSLEATISVKDSSTIKAMEEIVLSQQFGSEECALVLSNLNQTNSSKNPSDGNQAERSPISSPLLPPRRMFNTFNIETNTAATPTANTDVSHLSPLRSDGRRKRKFGTPGSGGKPKLAISGGGVEKSIFDFDYPDNSSEKDEPPKKPPQPPTFNSIPSSSSKEATTNTTAPTAKSLPSFADKNDDVKLVPKVATEKISQAASSATKNDELLNKKKEEKPVEVPKKESSLPDYIPQSFLKSIPNAWPLMWAELEIAGWFWTKGKGLIDFFYIKPNCKPCKPFSFGIDYFGSTDAVINYLQAEIGKYRARNGLVDQPSECIPKSATKTMKVEEKKSNRLVSNKKKKNDNDDADDDEALFSEGSSVSGENEEEFDEPAPVVSATKSKANAKVNPPSTSSSSSSSLSSIPNISQQEKPNIRTILWKDLWKQLRSLGWCWDFGPSHLTYFYQPGYDNKHDKDAILGVHKFTDEEEVRRFIKQQMRASFQSQSNKDSKSTEVNWWLYFSYPFNKSSESEEFKATSTNSSNVNQDTKALTSSSSGSRDVKQTNKTTSSAWFGESQVDVIQDAHLTDPSWNLVTHRKKRDSAVNYHALDDPYATSRKPLGKSHDDEDESDGEDEGNNDEQYFLPEKQKRKSNLITPEGQHNGGKRKKFAITSTPDSMSSEDLTQKQTIHQIQKQAMKARGPQSFAAQMHGMSSSTSTTLLTQISRPFSTVKESLGSPTLPKFLSHWSIVFSGIEEKPRERLEQLVKKYGGAILTELPKEHIAGDSDDPIPQIVLISQAKDFRKPKYIMSFLLGIPIVHSNWLLDSIQQQQIQSIEAYLLPISYSLLHSYYIYASPQPSPSQSRMVYYDRLPILQDMIVLNMTGMKVWEEIITLCGGTVYTTPATSSKEYESFLKSLLQRHQHPPQAHHTPVTSKRIDLVLFDPILYTRSFLHYHTTSERPPTASSTTSSNTSVKNILKYFEMEVLQHFTTLNSTYTSLFSANPVTVVVKPIAKDDFSTPPPLVVSVDWLLHCIAIRKLVNIHSSGLFTLPSDPIQRPVAYKSDMEYPVPSSASSTTTSSSQPHGQSNGNSTAAGERYSQFDLVYYQVTNTNTSGNNNSNSSMNSVMSMGKIMGFYRRYAQSKLFVRIRVLETASPTPPSQQTLTLSPHRTVEEQTVPVSQLQGKVILLQPADYAQYVPTAYAPRDKAMLTSLLANLVIDTTTYYAMSRSLQQMWPVIRYEGNAEEDEQEEEEEEEDDGQRNKKARKSSAFPLRHQASQDF